MNSFASLTFALEGWFDTALSELPDELRERVESEFSAMPWDRLSAGQRQTVTLQRDCQHDPATEQDRQFWWDHFVRKDELKAQIAQWAAAAAPTAGDLALRETRLKELRQELARTELHERRAQNKNCPLPKPLDGESENSATSPGIGPIVAASSVPIGATLSLRNATPCEASSSTEDVASEINQSSSFPVRFSAHGEVVIRSPSHDMELEVGSLEWRKQNARKAANMQHDKPGGSRSKQRAIVALWASGKYSSRQICAEQECEALKMSYTTARKALKNTPDPARS